MAVTAFWYGKAFLALLNKEVDWDESNKIKVSLHTSDYLVDQDVDDYWNDATNEVTGTGYVSGGEILTTPSIGYTGATNVIKLDGDNVTWASSTITARYAVVYYNTGVSTTSPVLVYVDFGENVSSSNGNFTIQWHADGIATITPAAPA